MNTRISLALIYPPWLTGICFFNLIYIYLSYKIKVKVKVSESCTNGYSWVSTTTVQSLTLMTYDPLTQKGNSRWEDNNNEL